MALAVRPDLLVAWARAAVPPILRVPRVDVRGAASSNGAGADGPGAESEVDSTTAAHSIP